MDLTQTSPTATPLAVDGLPTLYGKYGYWEVGLPMPRTATLWVSPPGLAQRGRGQMRSRVRLLHIALHSARGALPYFGVELACDWEIEHGDGIMFHGTEVVETGGWDVPNLSWIAARHVEGS